MITYAVVTTEEGTNVFFGEDDQHLWEQIEEVYDEAEVNMLRSGEQGPLFEYAFIDHWGIVEVPSRPE